LILLRNGIQQDSPPTGRNPAGTYYSNGWLPVAFGNSD